MLSGAKPGCALWFPQRHSQKVRDIFLHVIRYRSVTGREGEREKEERRGGKESKTPNRWCSWKSKVSEDLPGPVSLSNFVHNHCVLFHPVPLREAFLLFPTYISMQPFGTCPKRSPTWNILPPDIHRAWSLSAFSPLFRDLTIITQERRTLPSLSALVLLSCFTGRHCPYPRQKHYISVSHPSRVALDTGTSCSCGDVLCLYRPIGEPLVIRSN